MLKVWYMQVLLFKDEYVSLLFLVQFFFPLLTSPLLPLPQTFLDHFSCGGERTLNSPAESTSHTHTSYGRKNMVCELRGVELRHGVHASIAHEYGEVSPKSLLKTLLCERACTVVLILYLYSVTSIVY